MQFWHSWVWTAQRAMTNRVASIAASPSDRMNRPVPRLGSASDALTIEIFAWPFTAAASRHEIMMEDRNSKSSLRNPMAILAMALERQADEESDPKFAADKRAAARKMRELAAKEPKPE